MIDLLCLQQRLNITFSNPNLLRLALIHSSYINEKPGIAPDSNERLEFLGDAILGLVIAQKLYQDFPDSAEGELTRLRSALVRRETLAQIAKIINLGDYLVLGKGEESGGGRDKPANLAGAFEALIAAIYLDQNIEITRDFILRLFGSELYKQAHRGVTTDYKSILQEIMQAKFQVAPSYYLIEAEGPDHAKRFVIEVRLGNSVLATGTGNSKKIAEMEAAHLALKSINQA
jgi:ribonuclease-3